ncbi:MAG: TerB N-terminal domain-containing protein [Clostridia bacterium]|nr:TerB N-terminal domain-containing protein [Clostridia bacterium]
MGKYDENNRKKAELDSFWDISSLIPKRSFSFGIPVDTSPKEIRGEQGAPNGGGSSSDGTVITRYIPPHSPDGGLSRVREEFEPEVSYAPEDSLIHRVILKRKKSAYQYYQEFMADALRFLDRRGDPCDCVSYFSYVPQYNQLNKAQLSYYFWFRDSVGRGSFPKTDYSYILLYIYELINLGDRLDVKESQRRLTALWREYHTSFPSLSGKLADWICDFSLIHRLPPPTEGGRELAEKVLALKEFYIAMPRGDERGCARSLLHFCTSYDFRGSKFYAGEHEALFDTHIFEALVRAVRYYSADGRLLSGISFNDCRLERDAYAGALCTAETRYRIEVEYCSFSRSNELRFLVGDIIKYSENKLRNHIGVKSKMTVYSLPNEVRDLLDAYFAEVLPSRRIKAAKEPAPYEALYEVPAKPLSLSDAARIERESWNTTYELIEAFEEVPVLLPPSEDTVAEPKRESEVSARTEEGNELRRCLGARWQMLRRLSLGDSSALIEEAREKGKMPDSLAEEINELAFEVLGDVLIESADGSYRIIEDYIELLEESDKEENEE